MDRESSRGAHSPDSQQQGSPRVSSRRSENEDARSPLGSQDRQNNIRMDRNPSCALSIIDEEESGRPSEEVAGFPSPSPELDCSCQGVTLPSWSPLTPGPSFLQRTTTIKNPWRLCPSCPPTLRACCSWTACAIVTCSAWDAIWACKLKGPGMTSGAASRAIGELAAM